MLLGPRRIGGMRLRLTLFLIGNAFDIETVPVSRVEIASDSRDLLDGVGDAAEQSCGQQKMGREAHLRCEKDAF